MPDCWSSTAPSTSVTIRSACTVRAASTRGSPTAVARSRQPPDLLAGAPGDREGGGAVEGTLLEGVLAGCLPRLDRLGVGADEVVPGVGVAPSSEARSTPRSSWSGSCTSSVPAREGRVSSPSRLTPPTRSRLGAGGAGRWQLRVNQAAILGNIHHEVTVIALDSVAGSVRRITTGRARGRRSAVAESLATRTTWPAAVSERSAALVHGSPRGATVLAAFPTALYLQVGGHADVLPVVTRDGLRLPTALARRDQPADAWAGAPSRATASWSVTGWCAYPASTSARCAPGVPARRPAATAAALRRAALAAWRCRGVRPPGALAALLVSGDPAPYRSRSGSVRSSGPGRDSPRAVTTCCAASCSGCACTRAARRPSWPSCGARCEPRLTATTSLSAALLREAADGYAVEPVVRLLELLAGRPAPTAPGRPSRTPCGRCSRSATPRAPTCSAAWPGASTP